MSIIPSKLKGFWQAGLLVLGLSWAPWALSAAVCTPTAATLCVGVDDIADVWINGTCVETCAGDFNYIDGSAGTPIKCIAVSPAILSATGANYIAVRVRNTAPTEMWGTWALDITCDNGGHSYATSSDNFDFYHDAGGASPPPMQGGYNWYEPPYVPAPAWGVPSTISGSVFGKRAIDPQTGQPLPPRSWNSSGSGSGSNIMYFRQGFSLTPQPTPQPPVMVVDMEANTSTCGIQQGANMNFTVTVCNTGGISLIPVTVTVTLDADTQIQYCGPWTCGSATPDICNPGSRIVTIVWPTFPGTSCQSAVFCVVDYYIDPAWVCQNRHFDADLSYNAGGGSDTGDIDILLNCCTPPTATPTPLPTCVGGSTFHLTNLAGGATVNPGEGMQTSVLSSGNCGFTPTVLLDFTPRYWYSPAITGDLAAGTHAFSLWTDNPGGGISNVLVSLGLTAPDGSGYVSLGSTAVDVNSTGLGNHISTFNFAVGALNLSNQRLRLQVMSNGGGGGFATMVYNACLDFDTRLAAPALTNCSGPPSPSPTVSPTRTESPFYSPTHSPSLSPSFTPSPTRSSSPTPSASPSISPSFTATLFLSPTPTASPSSSFTQTRSFSPSPSRTASPTPTASFSASPSITPTPSITLTPPPATPTRTRQPTPITFKIVSVYPNPIGSAGAYIVFSLPWPADVEFKIYDLRGELVWTKSQSCPAEGNYQQFWGAENDSGSKVSYGAFYLIARASDGSRNESDKRWITVIR